MDDNAKHAASYQADQEILEARGINMTVEEVSGLSTCKYSERVQSLRLSREDLMFLKGLRRRIKNRLASQNSRRRSVEHLRRLTRELRAARAVRRDAIEERRALVLRRDTVRDKCASLRRHLVQILESRSDTSSVPSIAIELPKKITIRTDSQRNTPILHLPQCLIKDDLIKEELQFDEDEVLERVKQELQRDNEPIRDTSKYKPTIKVETLKIEPGIKKEFDANIFECKIGKLVQQSVNHIFNDKKKVFAKTVFIANERSTSDVKTIAMDSKDEVLNLCVKEGRRKSHGRKQPAPRRITYCANDVAVAAQESTPPSQPTDVVKAD